ncbi:hypothetical protein ACIQMO_19400 [Streptomyces sp. NPDC091406]|uniref:hypothetical protein n=1 Tax=unclassified Streptomyces TaxID=2593676 RepID=UPI0037F45A2E
MSSGRKIFYFADFTEPEPWWLAGTYGKPPRKSSRYERARVASLAAHNAISATCTLPTGQADDRHHDPASAPPHVVDHPGRDAALTPAQRAAAAHEQAAMPEEYVGGRTTDPASWLRAGAVWR